MIQQKIGPESVVRIYMMCNMNKVPRGLGRTLGIKERDEIIHMYLTPPGAPTVIPSYLKLFLCKSSVNFSAPHLSTHCGCDCIFKRVFINLMHVHTLWRYLI